MIIINGTSQQPSKLGSFSLPSQESLTIDTNNDKVSTPL